MRLSAEIRYDADPAAVVDMLSDTRFQERKCAATGALSSEVAVEPRGDGGVVVRTSRVMPTDQIPDFVKTFVGGTLVVDQVETWGPARPDGGRDGTVVVEIKNAPVRLNGTLTLRAAGSGSVESISGDIKASVPLIGGRIERAVEPALLTAIRVEQREGTAWLAGAR